MKKAIPFIIIGAILILAVTGLIIWESPIFQNKSVKMQAETDSDGPEEEIPSDLIAMEDDDEIIYTGDDEIPYTGDGEEEYVPEADDTATGTIVPTALYYMVKQDVSVKSSPSVG